MNTNNAENQDVSTAVMEYQRLGKIAERKLRKYLKAVENIDAILEEWKTAQKAADDALIELQEALR